MGKEKKDKNEYMKNYRKGKRTHSITLNADLQKKEDFILKNKNVKYVDIYALGLQVYTEKIKESSNQLEYEYKQLENERSSLSNQIGDIDKKMEAIRSKINEQTTDNINLFFEKIDGLVKEFMEENNIEDINKVNVSDLYDKYSVKIQTEYMSANLKPKISGFNLSESAVKKHVLDKLKYLGVD